MSEQSKRVVTDEGIKQLISLIKGDNKIINPIDGTNIVHGSKNLTYEIDATTGEKISSSEAGNNNLITGESNAITHGANNSIVGGKNNKIKSNENLVVGDGNTIIPAENQTNSDSGVRNIVSGYQNQLNGANYSILTGQNNIINAGESFIIGVSNEINKNYTLTLGEHNTQNGTEGLIIGTECSTNNPCEIIIGNNSHGVGRCQLVLGDDLNAIADDAIVTEGLRIKKNGDIYQNGIKMTTLPPYALSNENCYYTVKAYADPAGEVQIGTNDQGYYNTDIEIVHVNDLFLIKNSKNQKTAIIITYVDNHFSSGGVIFVGQSFEYEVLYGEEYLELNSTCSWERLDYTQPQIDIITKQELLGDLDERIEKLEQEVIELGDSIQQAIIDSWEIGV